MVDIGNLLITLVIMLFSAAGLGLITGIYVAFLCERLFFYLKKHHYKRWQELTTIKGFVLGTASPFRLFPYIFNDLDVRDKNILRYKNKLRTWTKLFILSAAFAGIITVVIILIAWYFGGFA